MRATQAKTDDPRSMSAIALIWVLWRAKTLVIVIHSPRGWMVWAYWPLKGLTMRLRIIHLQMVALQTPLRDDRASLGLTKGTKTKTLATLQDPKLEQVYPHMPLTCPYPSLTSWVLFWRRTKTARSHRRRIRQECRLEKIWCTRLSSLIKKRVGRWKLRNSSAPRLCCTTAMIVVVVSQGRVQETNRRVPFDPKTPAITVHSTYLKLSTQAYRSLINAVHLRLSAITLVVLSAHLKRSHLRGTRVQPWLSDTWGPKSCTSPPVRLSTSSTKSKTWWERSLQSSVAHKLCHLPLALSSKYKKSLSRKKVKAWQIRLGKDSISRTVLSRFRMNLTRNP